MTVNLLNRMVVAVGLSAMASIGLSVPMNAQPQRDQGQGQDQGRGRGRGQQEDQKDAKQEKGRGRGQQAQQRRAPQEQQELIRQHEQRLPQYRQVLDQEERVAQQRGAQLQQQKRTAQYNFQQQYLARLREQQLRIPIQGRYDYAHDPFFYTRSQYRYSRGGRYYETNQYGLDLLRQAVNFGYEEGFHAGQADRQDRWPSNYADCWAYQDANYGYGGLYVDRDDYNFYFREGFRRGYEDGYGAHYRYGSVSNGKVAILAAVLAAIVTYEVIR